MRSKILQEILNETPSVIIDFVNFYSENIIPLVELLYNNKIKYKVEVLSDSEYKHEYTFVLKSKIGNLDLSFYDYDIEPNVSALLSYWIDEQLYTESGTIKFITSSIKNKINYGLF